MCYDKNGTPLRVGDKVMVEFQVLSSTKSNEDHCDLVLETVLPLEDSEDRGGFCPQIRVNEKHVKKIEWFSKWVKLNKPNENNDMFLAKEVVDYFNQHKFNIIDGEIVPANFNFKSETNNKFIKSECAPKKGRNDNSNEKWICGFDPSESYNISEADARRISKGVLEGLSLQYEAKDYQVNELPE